MGKKTGKAGKKGKESDRKGSGRPGAEPAMDAPTVGMLIAAVIAGPPLWSLYRSGNLDLSTALLHWGLVAAGCAFGVTGVNRLIADYRAQVDRERRIQEMMDALEGVVHEGLPIPASEHAPGAAAQVPGQVAGQAHAQTPIQAPGMTSSRPPGQPPTSVKG